MSAKFRKFLIAISSGLLASSVLGCQGSNFGSSVENAIAPVTPPPEKTAPMQPTKPTTETILEPKAQTPNPEIITQPNKNLSKQIAVIALPSSSNSPDSKATLEDIFLIKFDFKTAPVLTQNLTKEFSDLDQAPAPLRDWIKDLNQLGTIAPKTGQDFKPNILISRREYARWLLETNNRLYANQPSRQIRLAQSNESLSFPDIPNNHPDFAIIQGLANAGLIGGTGDRFSPDDPLSREEMVQWKIPLDLRQPLPNATIENIRQSWGFRDSDLISVKALSAIFADSQLRDLSNIRRSFGFTTLLQPQKPITRAEAAASLWYFGTATDGLSVKKALDLSTSK
ncbi:MAG: hypothetical protein AUK48_06460 [Oscillatoriales cyanobacterium CG2_30_44_21]|nr:MAG: hypothetical protein AUK48_06460 [Oscillatoriales cyanobacterium CG2_30_44_21]